MVFQFTHSFREFLEMEAAPSLPSLFCSLHNHGTEVLTDLFVQLLRATLFDPGSNALTTAGNDIHLIILLLFSNIFSSIVPNFYLPDGCSVSVRCLSISCVCVCVEKIVC